MAPHLRMAGALFAALLLVGACSGSGQSGSSPGEGAGDADSRAIVGIYLDELAIAGVIDSFDDDRAAVEYAHRSSCLRNLPGPVAVKATMGVVALLDALAAETVASTMAMEQQREVDGALRDDSDAAIADLAVSLDDVMSGSEALANAVETYRTRIDHLRIVRNAIDRRQMTTLNARQQLADTASAATRVVGELAADVDDAALSQELSSMVELMQAHNETIVANAVVAGVIVRGGWMNGNGTMVVGDLPPDEMDGIVEAWELQGRADAVTRSLAAWEQSDAESFAAWAGAGETTADPPYSVARQAALAAAETAAPIPLDLADWQELQQDELERYSRTMESLAEDLPVAADFSLGVEVDQAVRDACDAVDDRILDVDPSTVE